MSVYPVNSKPIFRTVGLALVASIFCLRMTAASLDYLHFQPFAKNEDLPSPWVKTVYQDQIGYVWLLTNNNLV